MSAHFFILFKRVFDILLSFLGIVVSFPLWLLIPSLILLEDGGPVFFQQERVGKDGKVFKAIKFRTMKHNGQPHLDVDVDLTHDTRVTNVLTAKSNYCYTN